MKISNKDQKQIINIIDTIIEASEHFHKLTKEYRYEEGIYIFSSIVEGISVIQEMVKKEEELYKRHKTFEEKLTNNLNLLSSNLEKKNFIKITEILQFVFIPQLRNWRKDLLNILPEQKRDKVVTIGVFENNINPIDAYSEDRIKALINQANKTNTQIYFFKSDDVNFQERLIHAEYFNNNDRNKDYFPFPDVVHNIFPKSIYQQSRTERKLRKEIPFTSFVFGDKFLLPKKIVENKKFAELLAPFKVIDKEHIVHDFLRVNEKAVLKPIRGARGENIYFVQKKGDKYRVTERKKTVIMNKETFSNLIREHVLPKNYMVQKYINARTKNNEPFDFRAHMQKNGEGKWQITKIYPRTGSTDSIQIDLIKGGKLKDTEEFLVSEFGEKLGRSFNKKLRSLSLDLAFHIDKLHGLSIDEMGLDIAIDTDKRFWLHEANIGPQTFAHEEERAVNVIAYSRYIAQNQIFHTNQYNNRNLLKGQFNADNTKLEFKNIIDTTLIGIMGRKGQIDDFVLSTAFVSKYKNAELYYFSPEDVDYENSLIRGKFYENDHWKEKVVRYPDIIYDRLKLSTKKDNVYEEFQHIPIVNEIFDDYHNIFNTFNTLGQVEEINHYFLPYKKITKSRELLNFIDNFNNVIVRPISSSSNNVSLLIEKKETLDYIVKESNKNMSYNKVTLEHFLKELLKKDEYFVMKYEKSPNNLFSKQSIKVQMTKSKNGNWVVSNYKSVINQEFERLNINLNAELDAFLSLYFDNPKALQEEIKSKSHDITHVLDSTYANLSELEIHFIFDSQNKLKVQDILLNTLNIIKPEIKLVENIIDHAIWLSNNKIQYKNSMNSQ